VPLADSCRCRHLAHAERTDLHGLEGDIHILRRFLLHRGTYAPVPFVALEKRLAERAIAEPTARSIRGAGSAADADQAKNRHRDLDQAAQVGPVSHALGVPLEGEPVGNAVAMGGDGSPVSIGVAFDRVVATQEAGLVGKIVQSLLEHRVIANVRHHHSRFLAEQVAHDHPDVAGADRDGQVRQRERAGRNLRGIGSGVPNVDIYTRRHHGGAGYPCRRVGDQQRCRSEIALVLQAADADRRAIAAGASDGVARHGTRNVFRVIAAETRIEADGSAVVVAAEVAGSQQSEPGKCADFPVGADGCDPCAAVVTQIVVEETAWRVAYGNAVCRHIRFSGATVKLRWKVDRQGELRGIQLVLEPAVLDAEPASIGKAQQAHFIGQDAPLPELGFANVEWAAGGQEAQGNNVALLAVHGRLHQQGGNRRCTLDTGLTIECLGVRGK